MRCGLGVVGWSAGTCSMCDVRCSMFDPSLTVEREVELGREHQLGEVGVQLHARHAEEEPGAEHAEPIHPDRVHEDQSTTRLLPLVRVL